MVKKKFGKLCFLVGLLLFLLTTVGHFQFIHYNGNPTQVKERYRKLPIHSINELIDYAKVKPPITKGKEQEVMLKLHKVVDERFYNKIARHTPFTNYLIWIAGILYRPWNQITDSNLLLKYSQYGLCSQIAQVIVDSATTLGIKARMVHLNGHTVCEVYYEGLWHMFDSDYGVVPLKNNKIWGVEEFSKNPILIKEFYKDNSFTKEGETMVRIMGSRDDNYFYPPNTNICPRIFIVQKILEVVKWLFPFGFMLLGLFFVRRKR